MKKVYLWGMGKGYEQILNQVFFEIYKKNIEILGIICKPIDAYCNKKDGFYVIKKEEIIEQEFDYLIITSSENYLEIKKEALILGVDENKIIDGRVFLIPYFDFQKYACLKENPITILSDDCWGGYVYNRLKLKFTSPLINTYWDRDEYVKFIGDSIYYLKNELTMVREGDLGKGIWPIGRLGQKENGVNIQFIHNSTFEEAKTQWDRRKKRINFDNILVKMGFSSGVSIEKRKEYIDAFNAVHNKKILFYFGDEKVDDAIRSERFIFSQQSAPRVDFFDYNDYMRQGYCWDIDIFCLLLQGENYLRFDSDNSKNTNNK